MLQPQNCAEAKLEAEHKLPMNSCLLYSHHAHVLEEMHSESYQREIQIQL